MIVINDYKFSSNINEVIRSVLNFLFIYFFYKKISQAQKSTKPLTANKKNAHKKHLRGKKLLAYLRFVLLLGCVFVLLVLLMLLVHAKSICKK